MPRNKDTSKYQTILDDLAGGYNQRQIIERNNCSFSTIKSAKEWEKNKNATTINVATTIKNDKTPVKVQTKFLSKKDANGKSNAITKDEKSIVGKSPTYNSRFLSWMASVLDIKDYSKLSKKQLKNSVIAKINSI